MRSRSRRPSAVRWLVMQKNEVPDARFPVLGSSFEVQRRNERFVGVAANEDRATVDGASGDDHAIRDDALVEYRIASDLHIVPQNGLCDACGRIDSGMAAYGWAGRG